MSIIKSKNNRTFIVRAFASGFTGRTSYFEFPDFQNAFIKYTEACTDYEANTWSHEKFPEMGIYQPIDPMTFDIASNMAKHYTTNKEGT